MIDGSLTVDAQRSKTCVGCDETIHDQDFKDCWSLNNLRPTWKRDNRSKSDKMPDGTKGSLIGRRKRELYEHRLAEMAAGGITVNDFGVT